MDSFKNGYKRWLYLVSTTKKVLVSVTSYLTKHSIPFLLGILSSVLLSTELALFAIFGLIAYNFLFAIDEKVTT